MRVYSGATGGLQCSHVIHVSIRPWHPTMGIRRKEVNELKQLFISLERCTANLSLWGMVCHIGSNKYYLIISVPVADETSEGLFDSCNAVQCTYYSISYAWVWKLVVPY